MLATFVLFYCNNYTAMYMHICISCLHSYCIVGYFWGCNCSESGVIPTFQENFYESSRALSDFLLLKVNISVVKFSQIKLDLWKSPPFKNKQLDGSNLWEYVRMYLCKHACTNYSDKFLSNMKQIYKLNI